MSSLKGREATETVLDERNRETKEDEEKANNSAETEKKTNMPTFPICLSVTEELHPEKFVLRGLGKFSIIFTR